MPIQLDTPQNAAGQTYSMATFTEIHVRNMEKSISFRVQFGNFDAAKNWIPGVLPPELWLIQNVDAYIDKDGTEVDPDPEYNVLIASHTAQASDEVQPGDGGFKTAAAFQRGIYEWLQSKDARFAGSIL